jgi:hypothetical protein
MSDHEQRLAIAAIADERDRLRTDYAAAIARAARAEEQYNKLKEWTLNELRPFQHGRCCEKSDWYCKDRPCTCGLDAILTGTPSEHHDKTLTAAQARSILGWLDGAEHQYTDDDGNTTLRLLLPKTHLGNLTRHLATIADEPPTEQETHR